MTTYPRFCGGRNLGGCGKVEGQKTAGPKASAGGAGFTVHVDGGKKGVEKPGEGIKSAIWPVYSGEQKG